MLLSLRIVWGGGRKGEGDSFHLPPSGSEQLLKPVFLFPPGQPPSGQFRSFQLWPV